MRSHLTCRVRAWIGVACLVALLAQAEHARAAFVDYLYVDGNEGQASGGHTAIAFDGQTFHFQYRDGWILPVRDASWAFERNYRVLENRNIRVHRIEVEEASFEALRNGFNARYFESEVLLDERARLQQELAARDADVAPAVLPAAGYFWSESEVAAALEAHPGEGPAALADRLSRRAQAESRKLLPGTWFVVENFPIDDAARRTLEAWGEQLRASIARLDASARPDRGEVRFVLLAREAALRLSLAEGRLHVLDAWPEVATRLSIAEIGRRGGRLDEMATVLSAERARALAMLDGRTNLDETDWSRIEDAANRAEEVAGAAREGRPLRVFAERLHPQLGVSLPAKPRPGEPGKGDAVHVAAALKAIEARLDRESAYNLVARNCVSEIFATIDRVLSRSGSDEPGGASREHLGGRVEVAGSLAFVPFVSADAVEREYRVVETLDWPSHRRARLRELRDEEGDGLLVTLREMNTLTSTIYRRNGEDSVFLFFTDEKPALRPLLGTANLVVGLGAAAVGLPWAPFDGGELLDAGLRGAFWSVPELAAFSVRKGTFFFVSDAGAVGSGASVP